MLSLVWAEITARRVFLMLMAGIFTLIEVGVLTLFDVKTFSINTLMRIHWNAQKNVDRFKGTKH